MSAAFDSDKRFSFFNLDDDKVSRDLVNRLDGTIYEESRAVLERLGDSSWEAQKQSNDSAGNHRNRHYYKLSFFFTFLACFIDLTTFVSY